MTEITRTFASEEGPAQKAPCAPKAEHRHVWAKVNVPVDDDSSPIHLAVRSFVAQLAAHRKADEAKKET